MGFLLVICGAVVAQQFRISEYDGTTLTIEYPPSFEGAYLFVESSSNLTSNVVWEAVDYTEVDLVLGATVFYSPSATNTSSSSTNETAVPYEITPEYMEALSNGEIENSAWTAGSVWDSTTDGAKGFFRIFGLSFIDTDDDGVDNVSEYGAGTDPYVSDAPPVTLPPDDGDPQPVLGSVDSAPGDWNSAPSLVYKNNGSAWQIINALTLALDGTNGTFTAQTVPAVLGSWIELKCSGAWGEPASGYVYPIVGDGSFYRTEEPGSFQWAGMEKIYPLALTAYNGSEQFLNHLIQTQAADVAGLATLKDGSPVLVDAQNPWTEEKLQACLQHLKTVRCRLQKVNSGAFDPSDTTAMARGYEQQDQDPVTSRATLRLPISLIELTFLLNSNVDWVLQSDFIYVRNMKFEFLDSLEALGFGKTKYTGYVGIEPPFEWRSGGIGYERKIVQPSVAAWAIRGSDQPNLSSRSWR